MKKIATKKQIRNYTLDKCPICDGGVIKACRCLRNER